MKLEKEKRGKEIINKDTLEYVYTGPTTHLACLYSSSKLGEFLKWVCVLAYECTRMHIHTCT